MKHVMCNQKYCLHCGVTKHFNKARNERQTLVTDRLYSVHFLSPVGDEKGWVTAVIILCVMLDKQVAADGGDEGHKSLLDKTLHVEAEYERT